MNDARGLPGDKVLVVGDPGVFHVGAHLSRAAAALGLRVMFCDATKAFGAPAWVTKVNWWLRGHRPPRLRAFSRQVAEACREFLPSWMLTTGLAPVEAWALEAIGKLGVGRLNYLTDDPWNPAHRPPWFLEALPLYDHVFSPRRANLAELRQAGCPTVSYLPFAYAPEVHFAEPRVSPEEEKQFVSDVVFVGSGDRDRVPYISRMVREGFNLGLYGNRWQRFRETRGLSPGQADVRTMRLAIRGAKVALCLVRRANRDGNTMRTFEIPAIGTCMLTEDTEEHRDIFGRDGEAVAYFGSVEEMMQKLRWLLEHNEERRRLARAAHERITRGRHTYKDRLITMVGLAGDAA